MVVHEEIATVECLGLGEVGDRFVTGAASDETLECFERFGGEYFVAVGEEICAVHVENV